PLNAKISSERVGKYYRHIVSPPDDHQQRTIFLHVLFPTEAAVDKMPRVTWRESDGKLTVTVGDLSHIFGE
ncbi:MAG: hypothetical protein N2255_07985, partial [Kiritimatiellae bacterium]|nr:hypothetical protein [Kiritimatiellia bacterium]